MIFSNSTINDSTLLSPVQFIKSKIENDDLILITSTEKLSQKWNVALLRESGKAFHLTGIFSFRNFINHLSKTILNKEIIDELVENELIVKSIESSSTLKLSLKSNYNYITQISSIIRGLREDGIRASNIREDLLDNIDKGKHDNDRLNDLYDIMRNYENTLDILEMYDYPLATEILTLTLKDNKSFTNNKLLFNNFINFRKPDIDLLEVLSLSNNKLVINSNYSLEKGPFIGNDNFFVNDLLEIGFIPYSNERQLIDIKLLETDLGFDESTIKVAENNKNKIELYKYSTIREESYGITKLVKYLLLNKELNLKPSDICVVSRDVGSYSLLLREFFADNQIPTNITDRYELSKSPVINGIFHILESPINNYRLSSLQEVFNSAYLDVGIESPKELLHLAKKYKLIGGIPGMGITNFLTQLTTRLNSIKTAINENNGNQYHSRKYNKQLKDLEKASTKFKLLEQKFGTIDVSKQYSIEDFITLINNIIHTFSIKNKIQELTDWINVAELTFNDKVFYTERVEKDARALFKFMELLAKLNQLELGFDPQRKYSLEELINKLKGIVSITRYQIREKKGYGVEVTSIEQTRGMNYKIRIMAGAIEGMMPVPFKTDKLVGKIIQDSERRHFYQEYAQFHEFMNNDARFYIFSHLEDNDEAKLVSQFVTPLETINGIGIYNEDSNLEWQQAIINRRELILAGLESPIEEVSSQMEEYRKRTDLEVDSGLEIEMIAEQINHEEFSVSRIESFKNYTYDFFYSNTVNLEIPENIEIFLSKLELGNLIHKSIEDTFTIYKSAHKECIIGSIKSKDNKYSELDLVELKQTDKVDLIKLFKTTVKEKLSIYKSQHQFFNLDQLLLLGDEEYDGIMIKWFENIIDRHISDDFYILAVEFPFYKEKLDTIGVNPFFKGKIDRIDISKDFKSYRIIDYKTSETERDGLQLAIYARILQNIFKNGYGLEVEPDGLIYDSFRYKSDSKNLLGYHDIIEKYKVKGNVDDEINKLLAKAISIIEQLYILDFSGVKGKNNNSKYDSKEIKLLKRD